uniref:Serpin domain-containing protein n=1 Tax=Panagrolaimus davidi TaxID=227884 RepID=A0A914P6J7_9BILA
MAKKFESINEAQLSFALELLRSQHSDDKSAVFSPASIATSVAMVYLGAQSETANQIRIAMGLGFTESEIHSYFSTLMKHTKSDYGVKVPPPEPEIDPNDTKALQERISELAFLRHCNPYTSQCVLETINRIYVNDQTILKDNFVDKFDKFYQGGIEKVKFTEDKTVEIINNFIAEVTRNKINNIVKKSDFNETTKIVLINSIYFKGKWAKVQGGHAGPPPKQIKFILKGCKI